jgi:Domain of unknown function (DUF4351)
MEITTSWKEEGIQEGSIKILLRLLNKRFGKVDEAIQNKLASLSLKKLEKFSDSIFEFESDKDVELWLKKFAK